jgi:hypothetical protein
MPSHALKAQWIVTAGVIPGQKMDEYSKAWYYTSPDYEKDCERDPESTDPNIFTTMLIEVNDYAMSITDPRTVNWVKMEFMWV